MIAGRDRELLNEPYLWQQLVQLAKDEKAKARIVTEIFIGFAIPFKIFAQWFVVIKPFIDTNYQVFFIKV